ncbi:type II secretion system F family protein [Albirhodobacter sp. R86504]|jgi:tight adherence protein C|uniref:type II secretion system F family protein n=1 Tax=Albirhodobacter sp. R86504 TaxID=3093848 RepID=UPI00366E1505
MEAFAPLKDMLIANFGPLGPVFGVGALALLMVLGAVPLLLRKRADPLDKLRNSDAAQQWRAASSNAPSKLRHAQGTDKLDKFAGFLEPQTEEEMSASRLLMTRAGYRGKNAVRTFHAIQFIAGIGSLMAGVVYTMITSAEAEMTTASMAMSVLLPASAGYYLPKYWLNNRVETRTEEIQNAFPDTLDMLLVCVEAGQSLDQGIIRVSKELERGYPVMAGELEQIAQEMKAGKEKISVLRAFGERSGVQDVMSFVTVMIQSQTFGTSIAESLRVYSAEMRDKRVMRAEEAANKIPTKMTLGTMMFTVPPLLIILVGPSVYDMLQTFQNMGAG